MSLPPEDACYIIITEDGYPPTERHLLTECTPENHQARIADRRATEIEMLVLPICKACAQIMKKTLTAKEQRDKDAHQVAWEAAGEKQRPQFIYRAHGDELPGGLPTLGKGHR